MKYTRFSYYSILLLTGLTLSSLACKTLAKELPRDQVAYTLLLRSSLDDTYLNSEYKDFGIQQIKKSSRSQNQYTVLFLINIDQENDLNERLKGDTNIVQFKKQETSDIKIENSKNN